MRAGVQGHERGLAPAHGDDAPLVGAGRKLRLQLELLRARHGERVMARRVMATRMPHVGAGLGRGGWSRLIAPPVNSVNISYQ